MKQTLITDTVQGLFGPVADTSHATILHTDDDGRVVRTERVVNVGSNTRPVYIGNTPSQTPWKPRPKMSF